MEENNQNDTKKNITNPISSVILILLFAVVIPVVLILCNVPKVAVIVVGVLCGSILTFVYLRKIYFPTKKLGKYITAISNGDFGERIELKNSLPELHSLSKDLDLFVNNSLNNLISDLKIEILHTQDTSNDFLTKVQDAVTNSSRISLGADYIRERVENLQTLADGNSTENNLIRQNIAEYRILVQNQSTKIQETGATIDEIISNLKSSAQKLNEKKELSAMLNSITNDVFVKVKDTTDNVGKINENLDMLHNTIKVIASVANKTNLLAMNASIEAAHAGKSGAGFSVVAEEIRTLSEQTNKQVKAITSSLKNMTETIQHAVDSSRQTGVAFDEIKKQVQNYVETFDTIIDDYTETGKKNEKIANSYEVIRNVEKSLSEEVEKIDSSIEKNTQKMHGINSCITEIGNIVDRNTKEALALSRSQDPIYINAVTNGKKLEIIRRKIDVFRLSSVPMSIWTADKNQLWIVIQALFDHLDWTVDLLKFLHEKSNSVECQITKGSTKFDKWLYGEGKQKYGSHSCLQNMLQFDEDIHEKAGVLVKLRNAGKEHEATIEFSEILELSRKLVIELGTLKTYIVKNLTKHDSGDYEAEKTLNTSQNSELIEANESFIQAEKSIQNKNNNTDIEEAEPVDVLEDAEPLEVVEEGEPLKEAKTAEKVRNQVDNDDVTSEFM